jgi:hypothetical protein
MPNWDGRMQKVWAIGPGVDRDRPPGFVVSWAIHDSVCNLLYATLRHDDFLQPLENALPRAVSRT